MQNVSSSNSQAVNVPKLRFPGFEEEWDSQEMKNVACYNKKRVSVSKNQFVSTENMKQNCNGIEIYNETTLVDGIEFRKNDILIANIRPYLKKAWKANFVGACSSDVLSINPTEINSDFFFHCIEKNDFFNYVMSAAKGSKMPRGDKQHIMQYKINIPSLTEQKKISDFFTLLNKKIEKQQALVESLKLYKRGLIQTIFEKFITESNSDEIAIEELFENIIDKGYSNETVLTIIQGFGTIPRDAVERRISYNKKSVSTYKRVKKNDYIMHLRSFEGGLEIANEQGIVSPAYTILRAKKKISPNFYYSYFRSYTFINDKLRITVEGIRDGKSINMSSFWKIKIPFPSYKLQSMYGNIISSFDKKVAFEEDQLTNMNNIKRYLLSNLFV